MRLAILATIAFMACCTVACHNELQQGIVITFPGSAVGAEAEVLRRQLTRFMEDHPEITVIQRTTPDAADQRHQLYVQWLNAGGDDPDILQLDIIWTAEFAAAGWLLPLDSFAPDLASFFPVTVAANRWERKLYALPWFVDVGMLYWRTDLLDRPPLSFASLLVRRPKRRHEQDSRLVSSGREPAMKGWSPSFSSTSVVLAGASLTMLVVWWLMQPLQSTPSPTCETLSIRVASSPRLRSPGRKSRRALRSRMDKLFSCGIGHTRLYSCKIVPSHKWPAGSQLLLCLLRRAAHQRQCWVGLNSQSTRTATIPTPRTRSLHTSCNQNRCVYVV